VAKLLPKERYGFDSLLMVDIEGNERCAGECGIEIIGAEGVVGDTWLLFLALESGVAFCGFAYDTSLSWRFD
jgi:hypothetical protein